MNPEFWLRRWREGETGWHREHPHPALTRRWPELKVAPASKVLVPLCGATPDLAWLSERGHDVTGVELSPLACARFFDDHGWVAQREPEGPFTAWRAEGVRILQGDIFDLPKLGEAFSALYDRAATIALPPPLRSSYARSVATSLTPEASGLLITMHDPRRGDEGPPFSVNAEAARAAWAPHLHLRKLPPVPGQSPQEELWSLVRNASSTA